MKVQPKMVGKRTFLLLDCSGVVSFGFKRSLQFQFACLHFYSQKQSRNINLSHLSSHLLAPQRFWSLFLEFTRHQQPAQTVPCSSTARKHRSSNRQTSYPYTSTPGAQRAPSSIRTVPSSLLYMRLCFPYGRSVCVQ